MSQSKSVILTTNLINAPGGSGGGAGGGGEGGGGEGGGGEGGGGEGGGAGVITWGNAITTPAPTDAPKRQQKK